MDIVFEQEIRQARILYIEDEEIVQQAVREALEAENFEVDSIYDGQIALEFFTSLDRHQPLLPYDLILLDLVLPNISGWDLCKLVRRSWCNVPILILSAKNEEEDKVLGLDIGADDYLPKPFGLRELVARCRNLLRQPFSQRLASPILQFEDIQLYPHEAKVVVRGKALFLPRKEFSLLQVLMGRPYYAWTRAELLALVWGAEFSGHSKTLDVHIRQLRKKLELDCEQPEYIVTVRGVGYRFGTSG
ncbi:MAG: response regulator transcription factor [Elainellaceae cyanobacterium]